MTAPDNSGPAAGAPGQSTSAAEYWHMRCELLIDVMGLLAYDCEPAEGRIVWHGPSDRLLGYEASEMADGEEQWASRVHPDDLEDTRRLRQHAWQERTRYDLEYRFLHQDGSYRWLRDRGIYLAREEGQDGELTGLIEDVTQRRELEQELARQTRTDAITGALTRRHFLAEAEQELARALRYSHPLSILMVDIDHFGEVNNTHGHDAGDRTLQHLVELFWENLRHVDHVGRMGGEEFAVLLPETGRARALEIAERLRSAVERSVVQLASGVLLRVTVSVGVASYKGDGDLYSLMRRGDFALYEAKRSGRNRVCDG